MEDQEPNSPGEESSVVTGVWVYFSTPSKVVAAVRYDPVTENTGNVTVEIGESLGAEAEEAKKTEEGVAYRHVPSKYNYSYEGVPYGVFRDLCTASSRGRFWRANLKGRYSETRV